MSEPTPLRFYDTLTGDKVPFAGPESGKAGIYVCGPTVYDYAHLGHARCYVVWDVLIRHLRASGIAVNYVRNITDIDDKILKRAGEKGVTPAALAEEFTEHFQEDMRRLGNLDPDVEPKVSEHLGEIIAMVETLIAKGHAYASDGDVYYAVESFPEYGKLSHRTLDALKSGASERLDVAQTSRKRHPADFALWKGGAGGWESPWGTGRPGWHIECSAMSTKHIGDTLDLHAGGLDLVFPHHENEIAQSEGATGKTYCRHWMHNGFVQVNGEKMGKSLGNFFTARVLFERVEPEAVRLWTMTVHYRAPLNLDFDVDDEGKVTRFPQLEEAERRVEYLYETKRRLAAIPPKRIVDRQEPPPEGIAGFHAALRQALDDDLNMPQALAAMAELLKATNELTEKAKGKKGKVARGLVDAAHEAFAALEAELGLGGEDASAVLLRIRDRRAAARGITAADVEAAIQARVDARAAKDFERADAIRAELAGTGVELHDTPEGTTWSVPA
ncbi:MAG: cysteine--tRNA ligase [Myxococcota bacterium]